jgi:integrase
LKFTRQRFQRGTLRKVARANNQWSWEYRYQDPTTNTRKSMFLSIEKFPTQVAVERHLEAFVLKLGKPDPGHSGADVRCHSGPLYRGGEAARNQAAPPR